MHPLLGLFLFVLGVFVLTTMYQIATHDEAVGWPDGLLAYGKSIRYLVNFFWICLGGFIVLAIVQRPETSKELVAATCVLVGFFVLLLALHLECFFVKIKYDDQGIHTASPWRSARHIPWSDIKNVRFSQAMQWIVLETANHGNVNCHVYLVGLDGLRSELKKRCSKLFEPTDR